MRRLLAVALMLIANSASAQQARSFALGADIGPALPLGSFADDGAELGWGANVSATVRLTRLLGLSAAYARTTFGLDDAAEAMVGREHWTDSGVGLGLRVWYPVRDTARLQTWFQAGVGLHRLDPLLAGPAFNAIDRDGILTLEGAASLEWRITPRLLFLGPTLRYRRYAFEVETPSETLKSRISWLSAAVGLAVTTGGSRE